MLDQASIPSYLCDCVCLYRQNIYCFSEALTLQPRIHEYGGFPGFHNVRHFAHLNYARGLTPRVNLVEIKTIYS